jgi:hypothetical protein
MIAEKSTGCLAYDTIRISPSSHLPLTLDDSSFCQSDSMVVTAPAGFNSYQWSTGASGNEWFLRNVGFIFFPATAANGCTSRDTIEVKNVYALPSVNIGKDTIVCRNVFTPSTQEMKLKLFGRMVHRPNLSGITTGTVLGYGHQQQ